MLQKARIIFRLEQFIFSSCFSLKITCNSKITWATLSPSTHPAYAIVFQIWYLDIQHWKSGDFMYFKILSVEYFLESKHLKSEFIYLTRDDEETLSLQSEKYGISYLSNVPSKTEAQSLRFLASKAMSLNLYPFSLISSHIFPLTNSLSS